MNQLFTLLFFIIFGVYLFSQTPSKIWYFGVDAGIDFNFEPPRKIIIGNHSFHEGGVTLTDENGDVLFYVDENTVYNRNNLPMKNGSGLIGNTGSSAQSPIALQDLKNPELVYIFYVADHFDDSIKGQFRYSIIDLCGDDGKGEVLSDKKNIRVPGNYTERLTATFDPIKKRYWILTSDISSQNVKVFELSENGLNTTPISANMSDSSSPSYIGMIVFNKQQNKIAYTCGLSGGFRGIILADFNLNTGLVTNPVKIHNGDIYDAVFSPNGKYLYATDIFADCALYKFDLDNKANDKIIFESNGNYAFNGIEEGPDGKIYLAIEASNTIGKIENPNNENEGFISNYLQFSHPQKVGAGLQSTHYFNQIIRERKIINDLGKDTIICGIVNILLDSGLDQTRWSDGTIGRNLTVTKSGEYYYYFRDCGILYTDTININFETQIDKIENFNYSFCKGDSIKLETNRDETDWSTGVTSNNIIVKDEGLYLATYIEGCYKHLKWYDVIMDSLLKDPSQGDTTYCNSNSLLLDIQEPYKLFNNEGNEIDFIKNDSLNGNYLIVGKNTCGVIEKPIEILVDTFPNLPSDSIFVCSLQEFPLTIKTNVSTTFWNDIYVSDKFVINEPGDYSYYINNSCGEFRNKINVANNSIKILPNIFSPNGDGINDFFPGLNFLEFYSLSIYDRWGNLIFEGNEAWDGKHKNKNVENGVYTYIFRSLNCNSEIGNTITVIK